MQISSDPGKLSSSSDASTRDALALLLAVRSITIPVVSGIIKVSVLWHFQIDANLVGRYVPALALPAGTVRRFGQVPVLWHGDDNANHVDPPIPTVALPARPGRRVRQVSIRRHVDGNASLGDAPIPTTACPSVTSARAQIGIRRYVEGDASLVDFPITATALPTPSVGRMCEVCVGGRVDGCAGIIDLSIASITNPPAPIVLCARIRGHIDGTTLGQHMTERNYQKPNNNQGMNVSGIWSSHCRHRSLLRVIGPCPGLL